MRIPRREAVRKPRPPQTAKHRVELQVRASTAASFRDEAFLKGLPIAAADKSDGTPARLRRGPPQMHKALPSSVGSSQILPDQTSGRYNAIGAGPHPPSYST